MLKFLTSLCSLLLLLPALSCQSAPAPQSPPLASQPPNILLIIADDQGYGDCSAYPRHASDIHTPNLDRLAASGALFTNAYVTAPACSPSRTGLISGRYQQRFDKAAGWHTSLPTEATTIAEHLRADGYATLMLGKNDFGSPLSSKLDDRRYPLNHGYDHHLGFEAHAHDYFLLTADIERRTKDPHADSANVGPLDFDRTTKDFPDNYTTDIFTTAAIEFAKTNHDQNHPFFIALAYNAVHDLVQQVPPKYLDKYGLKPIPLFNPDSGQSYKTYYNTYNNYNVVHEADMRKYYLANLDCLDDNIGKLLSFLDASHLSDNTLIIFLSDNGGSPNAGGNNQPLRGAKYGTFEGGIRIPFLARWPGHIPPHQIIDDPVISLDILPTLAAAANHPTTPDERLDGTNLLPRLTTASPLPARTLFWKFINRYAIRRGDWKLLLCDNHPGGGKLYSSWLLSGPESKLPQLFNLKTDPSEQHNLAPQHPEIVADLLTQYHQWESTHGQFTTPPNQSQSALPEGPD